MSGEAEARLLSLALHAKTEEGSENEEFEFLVARLVQDIPANGLKAILFASVASFSTVGAANMTALCGLMRGYVRKTEAADLSALILDLEAIPGDSIAKAEAILALTLIVLPKSKHMAFFMRFGLPSPSVWPTVSDVAVCAAIKLITAYFPKEFGRSSALNLFLSATLHTNDESLKDELEGKLLGYLRERSLERWQSGCKTCYVSDTVCDEFIVTDVEAAWWEVLTRLDLYSSEMQESLLDLVTGLL